MVIVLIATRYQKIMDWIMSVEYENIQSISLMKRHGPKCFLYVKSALDLNEIIKAFKMVIMEHGGVYDIYEFYGIYNGMIDYNSYLLKETKDHMKYYQCKNKDVTQEEMKCFIGD